MGDIVVKVCADCLSFYIGECDDSQLDLERTREIFESFRLWEEYQFTPRECSYVDFLNDSLCSICRKSLTKDRRRHNDENIVRERRVVSDGDRRTPFGRGSRVLLASLRAA
jgi:hypothetical protein